MSRPLSPKALKRRAIFLPALVVLTVWLLNVVALRTHLGPEHPAIWMGIPAYVMNADGSGKH